MTISNQPDDPFPLISPTKPKFDPKVIDLFSETISQLDPIIDQVAEHLRNFTEDDDLYIELISQYKYKYNLDKYIFANYRVS